MKIPFSTLLEFVPELSQTPEEIADLITLKSYEVDSVHNPATSLNNVVVGHIQEIQTHPNADKLHITQVDVGNKEVLTIVCGAKNIELGQKVAIARIGATLPNGLTIQAVKLRGQDSFGMICSAQELGLDTGESSGVLILPPNSTVGKPVSEVLGLDEVIIDIDNKGLGTRASDSSSFYGVAREVALITDKKLKPLELAPFPKEQVKKHIRIETKACSYYSLLALSGLSNYKFDSNVLSKGVYRVDLYVQTGAFKLDDRIHKLLHILNQQTHHPAVDLGNFVLFEIGQPVHVFDAEKIKGNTLTIREAKKGETLLTINQTEIVLEDGDIVICDTDQIIALAGIIGGAATAVGDGTTQVLIESAHFDAERIRKTARRLKLLTESAKRFERNIPVELADIAIQRIIHLVTQSGFGVLEYTHKGNNITSHKTVTLDFDYVRRYIGVDIPDGNINAFLKGLQVNVHKPFGSHQYHLTAPYWRLDLNTPEEYIEEIARLYGYDKIPATLNIEKITPTINSLFTFKRIVSETLVKIGYTEIITYPYSVEGGLKLINPVDESKPYLRENLTRSLANAMIGNQNYRDNLKLFEISNVFRAEQHLHLSIAFWDKYKTPTENINQAYHDLYMIITQLGFDNNQFKTQVSDGVHIITYAEHPIGWIHTQDLVIELDMTVLEKMLTPITEKYIPIPKYPSVKRDITIAVSPDISSQEVYNTIQSLVSKRCEYIGFRDIFVTETAIKYTFHLEFRDLEQSLSDEDVNTEITLIEKHFNKGL
jgi:phenylalanyl-tRNA synthetase beta chain